MESARPGNRGNTGGGYPPPPKVPPMQHAGAVAVFECITKEHSTIQEGGGSETMEFGSGGGKEGGLKGVYCLQVLPQDGPVLQINGVSNIDGG